MSGAARQFGLCGEVVAIADGDTLTVLDASQWQHKIRLSGIDAPEKARAFGSRSRQNLARAAFRKQVTVLEPYGRVLGKVFLDGADINLMQASAGLA